MSDFWKSTIVTASWRLFETTAVVTAVVYLTALYGVLTTPGAWATYDWRQALVSFAIGLAAGLIKAIITGLNLWNQEQKGTLA